jgi:hypothetical protein
MNSQLINQIINGLLVVLIFLACNNPKDSQIEPGHKTDVNYTPDDETDSFRVVSKTEVTHKLSLSCGAEYLPVRNCVLNPTELAKSNSGTENAKSFNDSTIIAYLFNDYPVELIEETEGYYKVKFDYKIQSLEGYILKFFCGNPTLTKFTHKAQMVKNYSKIKNPELLPYCKVFVKEGFHELLIKGYKSPNPLQHFKDVLSKTETDLILFSLFVGQSTRQLFVNKDRCGGDETHFRYGLINEYFIYHFTNFSNMFVAISPALPVRINSYSIITDTLRLTTDADAENQQKQVIKLFPLDSKKAFTSRRGSVWIMNDTIRLIDISYIADQFSVPESQIGHPYYFEILEMYLQSTLPKRQDGYLRHYQNQ